MDVLDLSRWQFGITTVGHFISVPLTIGLAPLVAVMQTVWVVTDNAAWYRLAKFFGELILVNFVLGLAPTIDNASSAFYALRIMTWVAAIFALLTMQCQGWTYWVFRQRISADRTPPSTRPGHAS